MTYRYFQYTIYHPSIDRWPVISIS